MDPPAVLVKLDDTFDQREQRIVGGPFDVSAWMDLRAALANDDAARPNDLAAVHLDAQPLCV